MSSAKKKDPPIPRRRFLKISAAGVGAMGDAGFPDKAEPPRPQEQPSNASRQARKNGRMRIYNDPYVGERLNRVAFPLGGIRAAMLCLEGAGALSHFSLRNKPEVFNEPCVFAAVGVKGNPEQCEISRITPLSAPEIESTAGALCHVNRLRPRGRREVHQTAKGFGLFSCPAPGRTPDRS